MKFYIISSVLCAITILLNVIRCHEIAEISGIKLNKKLSMVVAVLRMISVSLIPVINLLFAIIYGYMFTFTTDEKYEDFIIGFKKYRGI